MNKKFFIQSTTCHAIFVTWHDNQRFGGGNGEFRVGMEAGYAPFNWSQKNDAHGAVPIQGNSYAGGYDVQISKNCRWFRS